MLGEHLRKLRKKARMSGASAASQADISQSKLSKIETGVLLPANEDIKRLCAVYGAPRNQSERLLEQLRTIKTEYISWRIGHRRGFSAKQRDIGAQERKAYCIQTCALAAISGLLQVPAYARRIMELSNVTGQTDLDKAVAARLQRQTVLYMPDKKFEFLMTETALLSRFCEPAIVLQQLDRLRSFFDLPNVTIGFLPSTQALPTVLQNSFRIFDNDPVVVETFTAEITVFDPSDIGVYIRIFNELKSVAIYKNSAVAFLERCQEQLKKLAQNDQSTTTSILS